MNTYDIHLRKGPRIQVAAEGYTEDREGKRVVFHAERDSKDTVAFFRMDAVAGIHKVGTEPPEIAATDIEREVKEMKKAAALQCQIKPNRPVSPPPRLYALSGEGEHIALELSTAQKNHSPALARVDKLPP